LRIYTVLLYNLFTSQTLFLFSPFPLFPFLPLQLDRDSAMHDPIKVSGERTPEALPPPWPWRTADWWLRLRLTLRKSNMCRMWRSRPQPQVRPIWTQERTPGILESWNPGSLTRIIVNLLSLPGRLGGFCARRRQGRAPHCQQSRAEQGKARQSKAKQSKVLSVVVEHAS